MSMSMSGGVRRPQIGVLALPLLSDQETCLLAASYSGFLLNMVII
jgi:hypothetical protein